MLQWERTSFSEFAGQKDNKKKVPIYTSICLVHPDFGVFLTLLDYTDE